MLRAPSMLAGCAWSSLIGRLWRGSWKSSYRKLATSPTYLSVCRSWWRQQAGAQSAAATIQRGGLGSGTIETLSRRSYSRGPMATPARIPSSSKRWYCCSNSEVSSENVHRCLPVYLARRLYLSASHQARKGRLLLLRSQQSNAMLCMSWNAGLCCGIPIDLARRWQPAKLPSSSSCGILLDLSPAAHTLLLDYFVQFY